MDKASLSHHLLVGCWAISPIYIAANYGSLYSGGTVSALFAGPQRSAVTSSTHLCLRFAHLVRPANYGSLYSGGTVSLCSPELIALPPRLFLWNLCKHKFIRTPKVFPIPKARKLAKGLWALPWQNYTNTEAQGFGVLGIHIIPFLLSLSALALNSSFKRFFTNIYSHLGSLSCC